MRRRHSLPVRWVLGGGVGKGACSGKGLSSVLYFTCPCNINILLARQAYCPLTLVQTCQYIVHVY